jgi:hypothetical protein
MPQLIRPNEMKIVTKEGEVQVCIVLDLNINLTASGGIEISTQAKEVQTLGQTEQKKETHWAIPDFGPSPKIDFGKRE